jgi:hypothetical protein
MRPRIGASCATLGTACDYGACAGNVNVECVGWTWENVPIPCPHGLALPEVERALARSTNR